MSRCNHTQCAHFHSAKSFRTSHSHTSRPFTHPQAPGTPVTCWLQFCGVHGFVTMKWPESRVLQVYDFVEQFLAVDHPELGVNGCAVWAYFVGREDEAPDMRAEPTEAQRLPTKFAVLGTHGLTGEPCLKLVPYPEISAW